MWYYKMSDSTPHNQCTERIETGYWYMYTALVGGNPYKKKIHKIWTASSFKDGKNL